MPKVLCVCFCGTSRSQMMAAFLQKELGDKFEVESAGLCEETAGRSAGECAIKCMMEEGIDISSQKSSWIKNVDLSEFSHIVSVDEETEKMLSEHALGLRDIKFIVANEEQGGVFDPYGMDQHIYKECANLIEKSAAAIASQIRGE